MSLSGQHVMELFCEALSRPSQEDRAHFLAQACGDDAVLRARIEDLLRADQEAGRFLEGSAGKVIEGPGTVLGPYKLLEQIGEGGFGIVFMAEQTQPLRRRVAVKIVKPGMDSRRIVARFEAERQALALMEHPNIARVLDAGQTDSGRPYFVMELVRGTPITEFCDQNRLPTKERLELFLSICQAVQHAHAKGIIHRDLKPSNVLVTMHDGTPVVKVIDFGIAKALSEQLTDKTLFTGFAQMLGTPRYMSPEQSEKSGLDIDTRTDIYAMGVLLYELLTGTTPLDEERLRRAGFDEVGRLIREEEAPPPSTRISLLGQTATTVSAQRGSDPVRLRQLVLGELDWIVLKALEKDRNRRYETASSLAADVRRYLADEPVLACPSSRWYRFGKFVRRNKVAVMAAAMLALAGFITIAELAASNLLIRREQTRTQQAKDRAEQAETLAEQRAEDLRDDLQRLKAANILLDRSRSYVLESRWDDAHAVLAKAVELRPDHSSAWSELADLDARLGLWDLAAADFAREFELREADVAARWYLHAVVRLAVGDEDGYRGVVSHMRERFRGTLNLDYLIDAVRASVLKPADDDLEQLVELARHAVGHGMNGDWRSLYVLGLAHYRAGQHQEAARRLDESLWANDQEWGPRALGYPALAMAHHRLGQMAAAQEALSSAARVLDHWTEEMYREPVDKDWINHLGATAHWPVDWWDWLECRFLYREAKLLIDGSVPPDDPRVHVLRARALAALRRHSPAEAEYAMAFERLPQDPQIRLERCRNRGYGFIDSRQWSKAAAEFDLAGELKPNDVYLGLFGAVGHVVAGEVDAYRQTCAALIERFAKTEDVDVARVVVLACVLRPDALADMSRLLPSARVVAAPDGASPPETGAALYRAGRYAEAVSCFEAAEKVYRLRPGALCFLAMTRHCLGRVTEARQTLAAAVRWADEANLQELDDRTATRPAWGAWHEKLEYELLLDEVRRHLQTPFDLAKAARPDDAQGHHELSATFARLGRWKEAADAHDRGFDLDPTDRRYVIEAAYFHLAAGDVEAYRRLCHELTNRFGETDDVGMAEGVAKACLLAPNVLSATDFDSVSKLAERAVAGAQDDGMRNASALVMGLAEYRAGRYVPAIEWLERFPLHRMDQQWDATVLSILAMAKHGLKDDRGAQAALDQATAILAKTPNPPSGHPFQGLGDLMVWLHAQFLRREAEELLKSR